MAEPKRVRQSDIAERLDLTKVSVSKALRDHPDISDETRRRVKQVAREMGYVPNRVARSLTSSRSRTLGVVMPKVAHSFSAAVLDGIHEQAAEEGYEIVLTVSRESAATERRHLETLLAMRVDGLLVAVSEEAPDLAAYRRVEEMGMPLVFFDRVLGGLGFSSVTVDDRGGARKAVEHLIGQGHRRVAHLAGPAHTNIARERRAGYEEALQAHGLPLRSEWIVEGSFSEESGHAGAEALLSQDALPEAIFTVTFPVGLGALDAMRERGLSPERDVQIAVFGNQRLNHYLQHPFVCVRQPARALGRRAAKLLLEEVRREEAGEARGAPQHLVLPTRLAAPEAAPTAAAAEAVAAEAVAEPAA